MNIIYYQLDGKFLARRFGDFPQRAQMLAAFVHEQLPPSPQAGWEVAWLPSSKPLEVTGLSDLKVLKIIVDAFREKVLIIRNSSEMPLVSLNYQVLQGIIRHSQATRPRDAPSQSLSDLNLNPN
jgi:hypothetical protein